MSLSKRFTNWALMLHTATAQSGGAVYLDGIRSLGLSPNLRTALEGSDGSPYNTFASLVSGAPSLSFATTDLPAILNECTAFMLVDSDGTHPGVLLYLQRYAEGGTRASANAHETTIANGIMVLRSLELSHQEAAVISGEVLATQSGATPPIAFDEAATIPTQFPATSVVFTLGKVDLNGTELAGVESVSIDFGVQELVESKDSDVYPTFASVQRIQPTITIRAAHVDLTSLLTEDGTNYAATQVTIYARKRAEGGTYVADATAEHIKLTLGKCRVDTGAIEGDPKTIGIRLSPYYTPGGSPVLPITFDTASAIA